MWANPIIRTAIIKTGGKVLRDIYRGVEELRERKKRERKEREK